MNHRIAMIAGYTGLVGKEILKGLLTDATVARVHCFGRRLPPIEHPKLVTHVVDFAALPTLPPADELYLALGTTIKVAGSQAAFRAIDFEANVAMAKAAFASGVKKVGIVSAMGADAQSSVFYNRVKGELEIAVAQLAFEGLVIARPSLLSGDRKSIGQPTRRGEELGLALSQLLGFLIPANYKPIAATRVANALLSAVPNAHGKTILLSGMMR